MTDEARGQADWTAPGAFPVAPGVHRVPLPLPMDGLRAVNVYVIEDDEGLLLIDGGWALAQSREALSTALSAIGYRLRDIRRFLVTHLHRDHYTQAVTLRREFGAQVNIGIGERPALELLQYDDPLSRLEPQLSTLLVSGATALRDRLIKAGVTEGSGEDFELPDRWVRNGAHAEVAGRTLEAIATPGHTQGHMVFADHGAGLLFAGDHVLPHITPSIGFEPLQASAPLRDFLDSLRIMLDLPDTRLLPAHGPVTDSTHQRVHELLYHHEDRLSRCVDAVRSGAGTAFEVAGELGWTRRGRALASLDEFNQMLAVCETHAHLQLLVATGQLTAEGTDPTIFRLGGSPSAETGSEHRTPDH